MAGFPERLVQLGDRLYVTTTGTDTLEPVPVREQDDAIAIPGSTGIGGGITQRLRRRIKQIHLFQFPVREECDEPAVRRPERSPCSFGALQDVGIELFQRTHPQDAGRFVHDHRNQTTVHRATRQQVIFLARRSTGLPRACSGL